MRKHMLPILLSLPLAAFVLADWQSFAVDEHLTVQLPGPPTERDLAKLAPQLKGVQVWSAQDGTGMYLITRFAQTMDKPLQDTTALRSYYAGVISGQLRREEGHLLSRTFFATAGGSGVEYKYRGRHQGTGKQVIKYGRSLLLGAVGYSFAFVPADRVDSLGLAGNEQRRRFFDSIMVKP
jgi:hypothetical protein